MTKLRNIALTSILAIAVVFSVATVSVASMAFADKGTSESSSHAGGNPSQSSQPETSAGANPQPTPQRR